MSDRLGDLLNATYPTDWLTRPVLRSVDLIVGADPSTDSVLLYATPKLRDEAEQRQPVHALGSALADVGGTVQEGYGDGRIRIALTTRRRRSDHRSTAV